MHNIAGSPVEGENFFGRQREVARLCELLNHHDVLLLGPRRIGKTSAARAVMADLRDEGWRCVEVNVASCPHERGFLDKLLDALKQELESATSRKLSGALESITAFTGRIRSIKIPVPGAGTVGVDFDQEGAEEWSRVADDLLRRISGVDDDRWLIYIDELPIFLFALIRNDPENGIQRVRRFLDWFRNDVRALPKAGDIHWLVSGSVGLDTLVQQHGMADTINSMKHETLEAFSDEEAVALLEELAGSYDIDLTGEEILSLVHAVRWAQPYYLQATFHHLRALLAEGRGSPLPELLGTAVERLIDPGKDNDFHHWESRLDLQLLAADAEHARALLSRTAFNPDGVRAEMLFATLQERIPGQTAESARRTFIRLRDILIRDAYWHVEEREGARRYRFRLEPLRRWWLKRDTL
ncbi:AAA family ATPase [Endothiovibrio diazotrophicus]